ncbi:Biopolymer transporter ExbD [Sulfidibacter corallicola]|uniref:Biopolymer transporter ExbD n=1 Tax=Sulfidibacter corallicola TaxID=2818388 RepID=A0A8A4TW64_SULCO|nr:biopolymer transporter ExbD [Sulfidibacter corallicola]QTD50765.1 biopolymer transporter ExbD [Sulfidibacter corallicola]
MLFRPDRKKNSILVDLSPLIDVVFLLLIFFMVSTRFKDDHGLDLDLPQSESRQSGQSENLSILIDGTSNIVIDGDTVAYESLVETVEQKLTDYENKMVVLRVDKSVEHGLVISVMDSAKKAGATGLTFATVGKRSGSSPR